MKIKHNYNHNHRNQSSLRKKENMSSNRGTAKTIRETKILSHIQKRVQ